MKNIRLKIFHKFLLVIVFVSLFVGISIIVAATLLSHKGRDTVLLDVSGKLEDLQETTQSEFNRAQEIASAGVFKASGVTNIENVSRMTLNQQKRYYQVVKNEIGSVAENVTATLKKQHHTTNETLDNLLSVSTDSMSRIMEFDNASLRVLASMAVFNVNNFKTISAEGLSRLTTRTEVIDKLLWTMQEESLDEIESFWSDVFFYYGPVYTVEEKKIIRELQAKIDRMRQNIEIRQRHLFDDFLTEFKLQSEIITEEMRLLTGKVGFAINKEIENSTIIQDENIDKVITDLLLEKLKINDHIADLSLQVKDTINNLENTLLSILRERARYTQQTIASQTLDTKLLAEKASNDVSEEIENNTRQALWKIDETIKGTNRVIEEVLAKSSKKTVEYSIFITVLCGAVAVFVSLLVVKNITNPISNVLTFADKMSRGDLSERLPEGSDEMGEMGRALNVMADELEKLQEATRNSFNQTLDQVIDCVFMFDPETLNFTYVNQGAILQLGYSRDELMSMNPVEIKPDYSMEDFLELLVPLKSGKIESQIFTTKHITKSGNLVPVEILLKYVTPPGNVSRYVAIVRDITERQDAKDEREKMQSRLLQAQKLESVGQLAAGIAHEINTPTQFIGTNIEFMSDAYRDIKKMFSAIEDMQSRLPEESAEEMKGIMDEGDWHYLRDEFPAAIEQSQEGVERVSTIVMAMKNFSHPGSKEMVKNNINEIIENTLTVSSNEWKYFADIERTLDSHLPMVPCLSDELSQVFLNLLVNAAHAIEKKINAEFPKGTISICTKVEDDSVAIIFEDNGCGISGEVQDRIFDPFFTTKEVGKGTGQGLAISHDVVTQKHQGTISVDSQVGVGSRFTIMLPLNVASDVEG